MTDQYAKRDIVYKKYGLLLTNAISDNLDAMLLGTEVNDRLAMFNMFHLLVQLRNEQYASCRPLDVDIECIRENLFCNGVDTLVMESVFPPSYDDSTGEEYDPDEDPPAVDGVSYMVVSPGVVDRPLNRVK